MKLPSQKGICIVPIFSHFQSLPVTMVCRDIFAMSSSPGTSTGNVSLYDYSRQQAPYPVATRANDAVL